MNEEYTQAKRRLGTSHWDKKLVANMLELSEADNYEDAHKEWIATGDVWWRGSSSEIPQWVLDSPSEDHKCLCGHWIVYHFRIRNTENGNEAVVGSDHINSYLIIRALTQEKGISANEITEEMIQEWLNVRVKGMKAEAWWKENGRNFTKMFEAVKEADLRYNSKVKEWRWSADTQRQEPVRVLRKRRDGDNMASIVWRWNHPENTRRQIDGKGYPNDDLMYDLVVFYTECRTGLIEKLNVEKNERALRVERTKRMIEQREEERRKARLEREERAEKRRLERLAYEEKMKPIWEAERKKAEEERKIRLAEEKKRNLDFLITHGSKSNDMLEYYGLERYDWSLCEFMPNGQTRNLINYISDSRIKELDSNVLRRIDAYFREAKVEQKKRGDEE